jgi:hypothetical protein
MKSKMFIKILLLIVIAGNIAGCKKYPDGPLISFLSAKSRLYGNHTLTKYTVNGADSLSLYKDSLGTAFQFFNNGWTTDNNICMMNGPLMQFEWTWELTDHNKIFNVLMATNLGTQAHNIGVFTTNVTTEWQILKLYSDDIVMQTSYNGKEYLIELTN